MATGSEEQVWTPRRHQGVRRRRVIALTALVSLLAAGGWWFWRIKPVDTTVRDAVTGRALSDDPLLQMEKPVGLDAPTNLGPEAAAALGRWRVAHDDATVARKQWLIWEAGAPAAGAEREVADDWARETKERYKRYLQSATAAEQWRAAYYRALKDQNK